MQGVKVKTMISLEVKTVSIASVKYKYKNILNWSFPVLVMTLEAINEKNPAVSKKTDIAVMDKNNTKIFMGLTALFSVSPSHHSLTGIAPAASKTPAQTRAIIQYVSTLNFFIFIFGKNMTDKTMVTKQTIETIKVNVATKKIIFPIFLQSKRIQKIFIFF